MFCGFIDMTAVAEAEIALGENLTAGFLPEHDSPLLLTDDVTLQLSATVPVNPPKLLRLIVRDPDDALCATVKELGLAKIVKSCTLKLALVADVSPDAVACSL
jgi:hypothetical protein